MLAQLILKFYEDGPLALPTCKRQIRVVAVIDAQLRLTAFRCISTIINNIVNRNNGNAHGKSNHQIKNGSCDYC